MNAEKGIIKTDMDATVTAVIKRKIKTGRGDEFVNWSRQITAVCKTFDGYVSTKMIEPPNPEGDYVTIITFDSYPHYQAWEESKQRNELLAKMEDVIDGEVSREQIVGLPFFLGKREKLWPPNWRMVLVAYLAIWPLVHFLPPLINPLLPEQPLLQSLLSTAIVTVLMGYVSLPLMQFLYRKWIKD